MTVQAVNYPTAPIAEPLDGTLLSIVTPQDGAEGGRSWLDGEGLFQTFNCIETGVELEALCGPLSSPKFTGAESPAWVDGLKFGAFGVAVCKLEDEATMRAGVEGAYTAAESRVIEAGLLGLMVENPPVTDPEDPDDPGFDVPGSWDAATDLTPAGFDAGVDPVLGLGLLESHMARFYAGKGIIHTPRSVATIWAHEGSIEWNGDRLHTMLRTPVAAGAGYDLPNVGPSGSTAPEGTKWVYGTGGVLVTRQRLSTRAMLNIFGTTGGLQPNDMTALAEAVYIVAVDCYKAAVLVKLYDVPTP